MWYPEIISLLDWSVRITILPSMATLDRYCLTVRNLVGGECDRSDLSPAIVHKYFLPYLESVPIRKRHQIIAVSLDRPETR